MTPDPYQASGGPSDPQSWNRYSYTRGDPVNRVDATGMDDTPPPTFSVTAYGSMLGVNGAPGSGADGFSGTTPPWFLTGGKQGYLNRLATQGMQNAQEAANFIAKDKKLSQQCDNELTKAGVSPKDLANGTTEDALSQVQAAAASVQISNGLTSNTPMANLYANANVSAIRLGPGGTVQQNFLNNPNTNAMAVLGGNGIYINPGYFGASSLYLDVGTVMHELLHNLTGLTDDQIESNLGITNAVGSYGITIQLLANCFPGGL